MALTIDVPLAGVIVGGWIAGIATVQLLRGMFTTKRDREVSYLTRELADANNKITRLEAQLDLLKELGFQGIHNDHAEILRRLPPEPVA